MTSDTASDWRAQPTQVMVCLRSRRPHHVKPESGHRRPIRLAIPYKRPHSNIADVPGQGRHRMPRRPWSLVPVTDSLNIQGFLRGLQSIHRSAGVGVGVGG